MKTVRITLGVVVWALVLGMALVCCAGSSGCATAGQGPRLPAPIPVELEERK